jgi:erythromycin esterase-like protein
MPQANPTDLFSALALVVQPLRTSPEDYDGLLDSIGDARLVLIGEASHGTHEFYQERALITRRLIEEKGFRAVAVEADWPDAYRVNRFVKGEGDVLEGTDPLSGFLRFPQWMWRNAEVLDFIVWLRQWNESLSGKRPKTGFYGLDLYGLHASIEAVLRYLDQVDPEAAQRARERYACFENVKPDAAVYGYEASLGLAESCEEEALRQLMELRRSAVEYPAGRKPLEEDEQFQAEQNARLIVNAERYYRTMFLGRVSSWNLRDRHMADTLDALADHLARQRGASGPAKIVVWEHNSHLGDARATEFGEWGEFNVGQLMRERHGRQAFLVGMTTNTGTVMAASDWGAAAEAIRVRPAMPNSYENLFHEAGIERFFLDLRLDNEVIKTLAEPRLERAIGVIYRPETERASHYFRARLPSQFDALLHFDHTKAVDPLGPPEPSLGDEVPETFPSAV